MKNLSECIIEALSISGSKILQKYFTKEANIKNAYDLVKAMEADNWELDEDYNNYSGGESVTIKLTRGTEVLWIEYEDKNDMYDPTDDLREALPFFNRILDSEYKK